MGVLLDDLIALYGGNKVAGLLRDALFGLEKESLRVRESGDLAMTSHPKALGDSFTDLHITTDFSESQLEFITSPFPSIDGAVSHLKKLHHFTASRLEKEYIWPFSMPCKLPESEKIAIARYGESSDAKFKEKYRQGLANRYGKAMQMLCGVHFNLSFNPKIWPSLHKLKKSVLTEQEFKNEEYLAVIRNFIRFRWLLVYLFSASPSFDESTYKCASAIKHDYANAISMRLSRCGYFSSVKIPITYNDFRSHLKDIRYAVTTSCPAYEAIGDGQINSNFLQISNENYFPIRLKPTSGQDILEGLETEGVRYLEIRLFDLNSMSPYGVSVDALYFVHLFLLFSLFESSPALKDSEIAEMNALQADIAFNGRHLSDNLKREGELIFKKMSPFAELLGGKYLEVFEFYRNNFLMGEGLLWQQVLDDMGDDSFIDYAVKIMKKHHEYLIKKS